MTSTPFWSQEHEDRLQRIKDDLAKVSTATACQLLLHHGWRNTYMVGLRPLQPLGLGNRLVGRARTCRYLMRRAPEGPHESRRPPRLAGDRADRDDLQPGDIFCVDALGVPTAGIIGDILTTRLKSARGGRGGRSTGRCATPRSSKRSACRSSAPRPIRPTAAAT